jgi:histidyl-tRNA synthetase
MEDGAGKNVRHSPDVYLVHQGEAADRAAEALAERLRDRDLSVVLHCGGGSFKSQMKKADASGASFAVILGDDEAQVQEVSVKALREPEAQRRVPFNEAVELIQRYKTRQRESLKEG